MGKISSRPTRILYLSRPFPYLRKNTEMGRKAGEVVSRLYLRDPIFSRDNPVFFVFIKSGKNINSHIIYPLMFVNINAYSSTSIHIFHALIVRNKKY